MSIGHEDFENNQKASKVVQITPLQKLLFDSFKISKRYRRLAINVELEDFLQVEFYPSPRKSLQNKRYLDFTCYDLLGQEVELSFLVDKNAPEEIQTLHFSLATAQRRVTSRQHTEKYFPFGTKSVDERLFANL